MEVNKEIYYHANTGDKLKIGDTLILNNKTHNKMYEQVYNNQYKLNGIDANELLCIKQKNNDRELNIDEFDLLLNTVNNDAFILRELALEEVRKNNYQNYPSRLNCLYVTKNKEDALNWSNILKRNHKKCSQILTLELTGEIFIGDGNLMKRKNVSYQNYLEIAEKYWKAETCDIPEYLFYGVAKVIDVEMIAL